MTGVIALELEVCWAFHDLIISDQKILLGMSINIIIILVFFHQSGVG